MSENERFLIVEDEEGLGFYIIDSQDLNMKKEDFENEDCFIEYCWLHVNDIEETIDIINEIYEENKTLKEKVNNLEKQILKFPPEIRKVWLNQGDEKDTTMENSEKEIITAIREAGDEKNTVIKKGGE